jgi:serine/threonine protein kinase/sugar lactone lactonase YvrE
MSPQRTIAHYQITAKLGEGGMGEVWRATDTKLNRDVAIKILPEALAADPDRMARFTREAQVLASLNHPNIAAIYGVEERALVMELVEGETLPAGLPLDTALNYARQIAEALEYAHEKGIIHRDLKPANIKVTPEGRVKVLDFGLAKAISSDTQAEATATVSPTLTMRATQMGVILGTAAYMAPEQARGQPVDKRADIWAFGVILYEMLTGRELFNAPTISDSLAAVLTREPDWSRVPAEVQQVLRRCLEKSAKQRLRDIADVRLLLEAGTEIATAPVPTPTRRRWLVPIAAASAIAIILAALFWYLRGQSQATQQARFLIPAPENSGFMQWPPRVSPDGHRIVFTATTPDRRVLLWLRELDRVEPHPIAGTDDAQSPFWSPDSRFLAFGGGGKLRKIEASGGPPQTICDAPETVLGGAWNRDGVILFGSSTTGIQRVSDSGGIPSPVTERSQGEVFHAYPSFLPDGRHFIYMRISGAPAVYGGSLDVPPQQQSTRRIVETQYLPTYVAPGQSKAGWLLFVRENTLMAQRLDADPVALYGDSIGLVDQILTYRTEGYFSASSNGVLLYRTRAEKQTPNLVWFDRSGTSLGRVGDIGTSRGIALSPDGTRVAVSHMEPTRRQFAIFLIDLARETNMQLTVQNLVADSPVWSPDGSRLVFSSYNEGNRNLFEKASSGAGDQTLVVNSPRTKTANDWSRDGRFLLYTEVDPKTKADLWYLPLSGDRKPVLYLRTAADERQGQFSPNGRYVAYTSDETGGRKFMCNPSRSNPVPAASGRFRPWADASLAGVAMARNCSTCRSTAK